MELKNLAILPVDDPVNIAEKLRKPPLRCPRPVVVDQRQS